MVETIPSGIMPLTRKTAFNTGGYVMPQRYAADLRFGVMFINTLILLAIIEMVPVVGFEPTRLVTGP